MYKKQLFYRTGQLQSTYTLHCT